VMHISYSYTTPTARDDVRLVSIWYN